MDNFLAFSPTHDMLDTSDHTGRHVTEGACPMNTTVIRLATICATACATVATTMATAALASPGVAAAREADPCERGEFCLWSEEDYSGDVHRIALANANPEECLPLPGALEARSFVNRTSRPVTVYQARDCATEGEFATYPGGGTFVPAAPYVVTGVQIWNG